MKYALVFIFVMGQAWCAVMDQRVIKGEVYAFDESSIVIKAKDYSVRLSKSLLKSVSSPQQGDLVEISIPIEENRLAIACKNRDGTGCLLQE